MMQRREDLMKALTLVLVLLSSAAVAEARSWLSLPDAVKQAEVSGQLILLHLRADTTADKEADRWIEEALTRESVAYSIDDMVLARAVIGDAELRQYRE